MNRKAVVTGGGGFIGAYLVKKLIKDGWDVGVIDTMIRGSISRLSSVERDIELHSIDVRDEEKVSKAIKGADVVFHLAAINGTENFYNHPELVLDVGIRGAIAVVNACRNAEVPDLVVASSAEVYQTPKVVPTSENVALMLPNSTNPRYSYGGSKITSELIALNYAREHFAKLQIFRPHNVYGPDMGWKHVIPQFITRAQELLAKNKTALFPIQGDGSETRAFCFVDDIVNGILTMYQNGEHRGIYHIGNDEEVSIAGLVDHLGNVMGGRLEIVKSTPSEGGTVRRCPDISKMKSIGYNPKVNLKDGLKSTATWYLENRNQNPSNTLL